MVDDAPVNTFAAGAVVEDLEDRPPGAGAALAAHPLFQAVRSPTTRPAERRRARP
jgi:hypothetical protein